MLNDESSSTVPNPLAKGARPLKSLFRRSSFAVRRSRALFLLAGFTLLAGCYERTQHAVLNPDGSGKMVIETTVAVPSLGLPGKDKPTALTFGRQVAADLINKTLGVEAWADVQVTELQDGRAHIAATAYFKDLNALRFDMPLSFGWKVDADGTGAALTVQRTRGAGGAATSLSDAELKDMVSKAQAQYKDSRPQLAMQLDAFTLDMKFDMPGEVTDANLLHKQDASVSIFLDGKKAMQALDKFMADDAALSATFKAGQDLPSSDDFLLNSMYGGKGPVAAHVRFTPTPAATEPESQPASQPANQTVATAPAPATPAAPRPPMPAFDYRTEVRVAQIRQAEMLKNAGIELIPKFIVNETRPASQPAPAPGRRP
jgi:hypothetical protein